LLGGPEKFGIATIGLIRPHIVFAPELARLLDDRAMQAALAHERAHVRHRDPLRIWIAQFVTDLQWPWTSAQKRFDRWLAALERARDDEARAEGIEGADLAAALVASVRFHRNMTITAGAAGACARLTGDRSALEERVARLLQPLAGDPKDRTPTTLQVAALLSLALVIAVLWGLFTASGLLEHCWHSASGGRLPQGQRQRRTFSTDGAPLTSSVPKAGQR
jgi:beta-lactamase regulating signal transducer with metallopeptidase domain